jgi:hypothetical protein
MRKSIYVMAFVLTTLLNVSCSSDDNGNPTGSSSDVIVGNWKNTELIYDGTVMPTENDPCEDLFYKFNSNGTGKLTEEDCEGPSEIIDFLWEKSDNSFYTLTDEFGTGGELKITFSNGNNKMIIYSVGSSTDGAVFQRQ